MADINTDAAISIASTLNNSNRAAVIAGALAWLTVRLFGVILIAASLAKVWWPPPIGSFGDAPGLAIASVWATIATFELGAGAYLLLSSHRKGLITTLMILSCFAVVNACFLRSDSMTCNCFGSSGLPVWAMLGLEISAIFILAGVYVRTPEAKKLPLAASVALGACIGAAVIWGVTNVPLSSHFASVVGKAVARIGHAPAAVTPMVDVGVISHDSVTKALLEVSNYGDIPLNLLGVSGELGVRSSALPRQLAPGVTAEIPVTLRVKREGRFISDAVIYTNHAEVPRLRAVICGKLEHHQLPPAQ